MDKQALNILLNKKLTIDCMLNAAAAEPPGQGVS